MNDGPPALPVKRSSWWERNWIWVAVLGSIVALVCFAGFAGFVRHLLTDSEPYRQAVAKAQASAAVTAALGTPVEVGFWVSGGIHTSGNGTGSASFHIPLAGPKGGGTLLVVAHRKDRQWQFEVLTFRNQTGLDLVDLLPESKPPERY